MKLDNLDLDILKHMQDNSRISLRQLGQKLETPHTTVFTRVKRLEKNGFIKKFSAILHPQDLGLKIGVLFIDAPASQSKQIAEEISQLEEVNNVYRTFDGKIIAHAMVPDLDGQRGLEEFLAKLDNYDIQVYPVDDIVKHSHCVSNNALERLKK
ncbi:MAG TPA: Lrp/AsnC family transcriptional regulator [Candidatus Altiarchaeales archaeon]|nr:Lrp/AsnC family transcriptional regulator [Candidatus Altiarchaeales archaeon]